MYNWIVKYMDYGKLKVAKLYCSVYNIPVELSNRGIHEAIVISIEKEADV